jgi:transcriptional regulator with PAS, ATPase and Fis domain
VAQVLHKLGPVAAKRFVVCNCSAVPETLWESEFFGHVRGAFTGAQQDKVGLFEYADGGTLFLDEVGEIPLGLQAKLLRALQNREIQRVGSPQTRAIDVRVVAATNRDLRQMVAQKQFREDLYYRLAVVELQLPALAERIEDLPLLQRHFIDIFSKQYNREFRGITRRAQHLLARHSWPGNVRELENVLGNACMLAESDVIDVGDLPASIRESRHEGPPSLVSMEEMQRRHAANVLEQVEGNKARAAEILGISRGTLYSILGKAKADAD